MMITVFGKEWFKKYNKQLCWVANSFIGDFIFKISKMGHDKKKYGKITEIHPNAITHKQRLLYNFEKKKFEQEYTTQFFERNEYALRLQKVFYPIWLLFHAWDMLIANKFKPAWNLGFDTLTVYPVAGANSPCDGYVGGNNANYATAHSTAVSADVVASTGVFARNRFFGSNYSITRSGFNFDTSALTAGATISSAIASFYGTGVISTEADTANIYDFNPNGTDTIITSDYANFGTTPFCDTGISFGSWNTSGYNNFSLNASGLANISKTGISSFGGRTNKDVASTTPSANNTVNCEFADNASNKPKLVVTYTAGQEYFKTCSETIAINDTLLNKTSRAFSEVISIVDSISVQKTLKRTYNEVITIVDSINAKKIATKILSEAISITDTIVKKVIKTFSEIITAVDSISIRKVLHRTLAEVITIVDTVKSKTTKVLKETIAIVDSVAIQKSFCKILSETISLIEFIYIKLNGVNVKWIRKYVEKVGSFSRKYSEKAGSFTRKYSEKVGTFIKKYDKDI